MAVMLLNVVWYWFNGGALLGITLMLVPLGVVSCWVVNDMPAQRQPNLAINMLILLACLLPSCYPPLKIFQMESNNYVSLPYLKDLTREPEELAALNLIRLLPPNSAIVATSPEPVLCARDRWCLVSNADRFIHTDEEMRNWLLHGNFDAIYIDPIASSTQSGFVLLLDRQIGPILRCAWSTADGKYQILVVKPELKQPQ